MHNVQKYKKALKFVEELGKIETVMKKTMEDLQNYRKYYPVAECIDVLNNNLTIIQVHLNHQKKIVESKGEE